MDLDTLLDQAALFLRAHKDVALVAHADADGICAATILEEVLGVRARFLSQVSRIAIQRLAEETDGPIVFADLGSSHLDAIRESFPDRPVLVLDHHRIEGERGDILLVNPILAGLDGTRDVSAAGLAMLIALRLDPAGARFAPIALIGAQADNQERGAFTGQNRQILEAAIAAGLAVERQGAKLYGVERRPLVKLIAFSHDLRIPGVTGDMRGARKFLEDLGLPLGQRGHEARFQDLSLEQQDRLEEALIAASPNQESRITHYRLPRMPPGPLRDTREAATVLNACGRLGAPERGVAMLCGDSEALRLVSETLAEYGSAVHEAHRWFEEESARGGPGVLRREDLVILRPSGKVPADLAGTLCSVLVRGGSMPDGTVVVCLATADAGTVKVSARVRDGHRDLAAWLRAAAETVGGEGGGHAVAAGAVIPAGSEDRFVAALLDNGDGL